LDLCHTRQAEVPGTRCRLLQATRSRHRPFSASPKPPLSTYIRNAALATSETIDLDAARNAILASQRTLREAIAALGRDPQQTSAA